MRIRPVRRGDLPEIDKIYRQHHEKDFSLPSLANTVTSAVIVNEGEVVGFGVVKILAEATMVLDIDKPKVDRIVAMQKLMDEAIRGCNESGIEQMHVFVKNPLLVRLLQRKFGFKVISDTALVLEI